MAPISADAQVERPQDGDAVTIPLKDALGRPFGSMAVGFDDPGGVPADDTDRDLLENIRNTGRMGEMRYREEDVLPRSATDYFPQNCWMGVSQPGAADAAARESLGLAA